MLHDQELAQLSNALQVPAVINDLLNKVETLDDETRYALHDEISEKQPDTALLAIAISALMIANRFSDKCPNLAILKMETSRIIDEYGQLWLKNANDQALDNDQVFDVLFNTAEDLEGLAELLEYNYAALSLVDKDAAELCDILQVQAKAHSMIAEEFLALADQLIADEKLAHITSTETKVYTDNVLTFPAIRA